MAILVLPSQKTISQSVGTDTRAFNAYAILSAASAFMFLGYIASYIFALPHAPYLSHPFVAFVFVAAAPLVALVFSVVSLKQGIEMNLEVRGMYLAFASFVISSLYFATALAMPVVLLGLYVIYAYIW